MGSREATIPYIGVCVGVFHAKCIGFSKYEVDVDALLKHANLNFCVIRVLITSNLRIIITLS